ncbi:IS66 family insertion sequence element accessory protein TnpB, partial [Sphingomonas sp. LH128]|uniref:IS66 family insertion sequence element accessory protein TnpB n=1 Tax=Sphingomonas sp. LH128 TaxID=473781 RepID=UPI003FA35153
MCRCRGVGQCRGADIGDCIADAGGCGAAVAAAMIPIASSARIWIAMGHTDMRKGMRSLALQVQHSLNHDVHAG